jgi:glycosyltransferase involved in cell wall biosynthesis
VKICLIGVTHFSHNPRLLREADSLAEAGHDVRVVAPSFMPELAKRDERQLRRRKWRYQKVDYSPKGFAGKIRSVFIRSRRRIAAEVQKRTPGRLIGEYSYATALPELRKAACSEAADWFIAHAQPALPIAATAAKRWNARLGFDCEDLLAEHGTDPADVVREIERTYLPQCDYISAPSLGIAERLHSDYGVKLPIVLYNVFPLSLAETMSPPSERSKTPILRLHWFSQTIGPGRGIEEAIEAAGMLSVEVQLNLRGNPVAGYVGSLRSLTDKHGLELKILPQVDHDDLIKSMDQFDVGLALERAEHSNYALTVTNKIGSYLLAGLAIAATDTPGQREVIEKCPGAGFLYPSGNPERLAEVLRNWNDDRKALLVAQQASWSAARAQFNWDVEKEQLLQTIH